ncbi:MAG: hypothetical protein WCY33_01670 [Clostridia bacterium]
MSSSDLDLYEGRMKIVRLDENRLDELDSILEEFIGDLKEDEQIHTSIKDDVMTVRILKKKE